MDGKLFRIDQVADALDTAPDTVRRWIARGSLKAYRVGSRLRVREEDLKAFVVPARSLSPGASHHGDLKGVGE